MLIEILYLIEVTTVSTTTVLGNIKLKILNIEFKNGLF